MADYLLCQETRRWQSSSHKRADEEAIERQPLTPSTAMDASATYSHGCHDNANVDEVSVIVMALQPPPPASAYQRATWRMQPAAASNASNFPSRGLTVATSLGHNAATDIDRGEEHGDTLSPSLSSPDTSTQGLRTPTDSPDISHLSLEEKEEIKDQTYFGRERATRPNMRTMHVESSRRRADVAMEARLRSIDQKMPVISQGYGVLVDILRDERDKSSGQTFLLLIDLGCDDTFVMGEGFLQIQQGGNNRMDPRVDWDNEQIVEGSAHTLMPHNFDPRLSDSELENRGRIGQIAFTDNCVAQLGLLEAKTCMFHCYDWTRAETTSVHLKWDFGVAFAVNEGLLNDPAEGILGVGLNHSQTAYYSTRRRNDPNPPSFLEVIPNKLNRVSPSQRKENVSIYFAIRLAPRAYYREPGIVRGSNLIQSWISFNGWPCKREPRWNERKIVVCGVDPEPRDWSVYLRSMRFMPMVDLESPRPRLTTAPEYLQAKLDFVDTRRPRGLCVILDTGASVTRLPPPFFQKLYHGLFRFKQNDPVGPNDAEPEAWVLPAWVKDKRIQIVYEFEGEGGQPVTIYGPFERFFYQHNVMASGNPMEALIYQQDPSCDYGVFGLNFFQSMYVSVHKALNGCHFVQMAPQWPENIESDLRDYGVPGM